MNDQACVVVWFRRDLRLSDHVALYEAMQSDLPILPVFILDDALLQSDYVGAPRVKFMLAGLDTLDKSLRDCGSRLLVRQGKVVSVMRDLVDKYNVKTIYFNRDYSPYARKRDEQIQQAFDTVMCNDRLMVAPEEIATNEGNPYTVYTPFKKKWRSLDKPMPEPIDYALDENRFVETNDESNIPSLADLGFSETIDIPPVGETVAYERLQQFADERIYAYAKRRNTLANPFDDERNGTSSLSPYIRFGMVSIRQIYATARKAYRQATNEAGRDSVNKWVDEVIWHEFYTHVLYHFPHVLQENFSDKYERLTWMDDDDGLQAWKDGQTGYPVIDAAMRQLNATGWMHNRARMIVASFLTKDLLIDWREGERYFMQRLLDGDPAANNGGWQWSASTGTDAQPYFRIFNPVSQSEKFDPDGTFIRQWVPELRELSDEDIHEPWMLDNPPENYPAPIVDHKQARERTLDVFKSARESS